jgi:hypothetical protein
MQRERERERERERGVNKKTSEEMYKQDKIAMEKRKFERK